MNVNPRFAQKHFRAVCETLIARHFPDEIEYLPVLWDVLWEARGTSKLGRGLRIEELGAVGSLPNEDLESMHVIAVLAMASTRLTDSSATPASVLEIVRESCHAVGAPPHLQRLLEQHGVPLLAQGSAALEEAPAPDQSLWDVDWFDDDADATETIRPCRERLRRSEIDEQFVEQKKTYTLFVDEKDGAVLISRRGGEDSVFVPWADLGRSERVMLWFILEAFHSRLPIHRHRVGEALRIEYSHDDRVKKIKSDLDKALGGVLKDILRAAQDQSGHKFYELQGQIPYCWIRPVVGSRLA